jgi:2-oxoglutarate dehydrogenase complex dehydrogenase (E1) component-like enzyme
MGAWRYIAPHLRRIAEQSAHYAGRDEGASTAVGSKNVSDLEQAQLVRRAFEV